MDVKRDAFQKSLPWAAILDFLTCQKIVHLMSYSIPLNHFSPVLAIECRLHFENPSVWWYYFIVGTPGICFTRVLGWNVVHHLPGCNLRWPPNAHIKVIENVIVLRKINVIIKIWWQRIATSMKHTFQTFQNPIWQINVTWGVNSRWPPAA